MRTALLLCVLFLAACPRQTNETVPMACAVPPEQRSSPASEKPLLPTKVERKSEQQDAVAGSAKGELKATPLSGPELKPPIPYLELGTGFRPAVLPGDVIAEYPGGKTSSDKSELAQTADGETVWIQGFTTKADDSTIGNYYNGLLGVKGFQSFEPKDDLKKGKKGKTKKKQMRFWRSSDQRYEVFVYDTGTLLTPPGDKQPRAVYVVEVRDRPASANGGTGP